MRLSSVRASQDPTEARKCVRDEWKTDCKGGGVIGRLDLNDCLFEMADVWTRTVRAEEYALFLRLLFDHITQGKCLHRQLPPPPSASDPATSRPRPRRPRRS